MALAATFTANFEQFDRELAAATVKLANFETPIGNVQRSLQNMVKDFSGARVIQDAEKMAVAVDAVGGASALTEREMARVNATVTEAIAKYQALEASGRQLTDQEQEQLAKLKVLADQTSVVATVTDDADQKTKGWSTTMATVASAIGNFIATALTNLGRELLQNAAAALEWGSGLTDLSQKTGVSTTALQTFEYAAAQTGIEVKSVTDAVSQMGKRLAGGETSAVEALDALGLSLTDVLRMEPADAFLTITDAIGQLPNPMQQSQVAMDLFGKSGAELLKTINDASGGFRALAEEARSLGIVISADTVAALDKMGDSWVAIKAAGIGVIGSELSPFIELLGRLAEAAAKATVASRDQADSQKTVTQSFFDALVAANPLAQAFIALREGAETLNVALSATVGPITNVDAALERFAATKAINAGFSVDFQAALDAEKEAMRDQEAAAKAAAEAAKQHANELRALTGADILAKAADLARNITEIGGAGELAAGKVKAVNTTMLEAIALAEAKGQTVPELWRQVAFETGQAKTKTDTLTAAMLALAPAIDGITDEVSDLLRALPTSTYTTEKIQEAMSQLAPALTSGFEQAADEAAAAGTKKFQEFGAGLAGTIMDALTGGGDVGDAIGGFLGERIGSGLNTAFQKMFNAGGALSGIANTGLGNLLGGAASAVLPGVGALLGSGLGAIFDKVFKGEEKKVNDLRDQAINAAGGFDALAQKAGEAGLSLTELLRTKKVDDFQAALAKLEEGFKAHEAAIASMGAELQRTLSQGSLLTLELTQQMQTLFRRDSANTTDTIFAWLVGEIESITGGFNTAATSWGQAVGQSEDDFVRFSTIATATFGALLEAGATVPQALAAMKPGLSALDEQAGKLGLTATDTFGDLLRFTDLSTQFQPLLDMVGGLDQVMTGLANTGLLTQDTFDALANSVTNAFQELVQQGVSAEDAMRLLQPQLQKVYELENQFGFAVGGATSELQDQAIASGIVGDQFTDAQTRMFDAVNRLIYRLDDFVTFMITGIPPAADTAVAGFNTAMDRASATKARQEAKAVGDRLQELPGYADTGVAGINDALSDVDATRAMAGGGRLWDLGYNLTTMLPGNAATGVARVNDALGDVDGTRALAGSGKLWDLGYNLTTMLPEYADTGVAGINDAFGDIDIRGTQDALHDIEVVLDRGIPDSTAVGVGVLNTHMDVAEGRVNDVGQAVGDVSYELGNTVADSAGDAQYAVHQLAQSAVYDIGEIEDAIRRAAFGSSPGGLKEFRVQSDLGRAAIRRMRESGVADLAALERQASRWTGLSGKAAAIAPRGGPATDAAALASTMAAAVRSALRDGLVVEMDGRQVGAVVARHLPDVVVQRTRASWR